MIKCSLIFLKNKDKILLYLRDNKQSIPFPNYWALIGGGCEEGETPLQTLKREINEEINCEVKNITFIDKIKVINNPSIHDHMIFLFKGDIDKEVKNINLTEGQKLDYFNFEEFKKLKFPPFLKAYIIKNIEIILD